MKIPTRGRFAPLAQVPLLSFLFSFSFEFLFDLNDQKRISTNVYPQRRRIDWTASRRVSGTSQRVPDALQRLKVDVRAIFVAF